MGRIIMLLMAVRISQTSGEIYLEIYVKIIIHILFNPAVPPVGLNLVKIKALVHEDIGMTICIEELLKVGIEKNWKLPEWGEWLNKF